MLRGGFLGRIHVGLGMVAIVSGLLGLESLHVVCRVVAFVGGGDQFCGWVVGHWCLRSMW